MYYRNISALYIATILALYALFVADRQSIDSLMYVLNNNLARDDEDKYELLCEIASKSTNADTILKYSEQAIKLAEELNKTPARPLVLKGIGYLNSGKLASALECFMNAANDYKADHLNKGLATAYLYISEVYDLQENHANADSYAKNAIEIFGKEKDSINLAAAMHNLGYSYYKVGRYDSALVLFSRTSEIYLRLGYLKQYAYCLGNSGLVYSRQSEYEKAEDHLLRAIEILTKQDDEYAITQYRIEYAGILQHTVLPNYIRHPASTTVLTIISHYI